MLAFRYLGLVSAVVACAACHLRDDKDRQARSPQNPEVTSPASGGEESARGGVIDGNGGELILNERNPWFVGDKPVLYCLDTAQDFSLPKDQASVVVKGVFTTWKAVLAKVAARFESRDYKILGGVGALGLSVDFVETSCDEEPPLRMKLGVVDDDVKRALRFSAVNTVGFARRTRYSDDTGEGAGYIWLAPDQGPARYQGPAVVPKFWAAPNLLHNILMHEVGHVLGFQHMQSTFLDERWPAAVVSKGLDMTWQGEDLTSSTMYKGGFCGKVVWSDGDPLQDLWGVATQNSEICTSYRDDLRVGSEDTPILLEIRRDGASVASQKVTNAGEWSDYVDVTGSYLARREGSDYNYVKANFVSLIRKGLNRGMFERSGKTEFVEFDSDFPGTMVIRFARGDRWQAVSLVPTESLAAFTALLEVLNSDP